ncbi:uncharacterized protein LODBEIA_P04760 [Lodderomyces beijingensis]|uniref:Nucleoporin Nup133/Nup155-like C-terminal domain-containing protein n=1 Tax=Lodderomyces beijingensis TaxID=1775926 RepID=A0ABP0ZDK9_9ASCO
MSSSSSSSIFQPRKASSNTSSAVSKPPTPAAEELTKNKYYCVSKLPGVPNIFKSQLFANAYSDSESNFSLVINDESIYVWSYKSADVSPFSIHFPIDKSKFQLPMAILTRPSSGAGQDPGLVILDSVTGLIKFYESVQHAPTLGLINDKSWESQISLHEGEYITLAENLEPAGVAVATSMQRCILISLRDFKSKPHLSTLEILKPNGGIFARFFKPSESEIVAIRSGEVTEHGTVQQILILDSVGTLHSICYILLSASTAPYVDKRNSFKQNLYIDNAYPGSSNAARFLDIWPLEQKNYFLTLCESDGKLLLATLGADKSGVLFFGSHQLKSVKQLPKNPKLFLPKPGKTAFVIVDTSIIMTDINTSYIESKSTFAYYSARWEDIIRLKPSTTIIGYGYENQSPISNPAIILLTKEFGVLRVERFQQEVSSEEINDPVVVVKSHIEQAIFYSNADEINFDLTPQRFDDRSTIQEAVEQIMKQVLSSTSPYLPSTLPSIADLTELKVGIFKAFINYCQRNFPDLNVVAPIVENLEKTNCALNLLKYINAHPLYKSEFEKLQPNIREFFAHDIENIGEVLTAYLKALAKESKPVAPLIVTTLYDGVYLNSIEYPSNSFSSLSWIYDTSIIEDVENYFTRDFVEGNCKDKREAHRIVQVLYYFGSKRLQYLKDQGSDDEEAHEYESSLKAGNYQRISVLIELNLDDEAIEIAERFQDYSALARILDTESDRVPIESLNYVQYFNEFGYPFAAAVYEHYLKDDKIQNLLLNFTNFKPYLLRYFDENPQQTAEVSWIRYLLDSNYTKAADALGTAVSSDVLNIDNQLTQLSVMKLSGVAGGSNNNNNKSIKSIDDELLKIRYQILVRDVVARDGRIEAVKESSFIDNCINPKINKQDARETVRGYYNQFTQNMKLSVQHLIDLLVTIDPKQVKNLSYVYALQVANTVASKESRELYSSEIILWLLTLGSSYEPNKQDHDDEGFKKRIQESTLYKTLASEPALVINQLKSFIENPRFNGALQNKYLDGLLEDLKTLLKEESYRKWVEAAVEQARADSSNTAN